MLKYSRRIVTRFILVSSWLTQEDCEKIKAEAAAATGDAASLCRVWGWRGLNQQLYLHQQTAALSEASGVGVTCYLIHL